MKISILMVNFKHFFDFKRFFKLLKFNLSFNAKKYLIFISVLIIVLFVMDLILINYGSSFSVLENNNREYFFRKTTYQSSFIITLLILLILVVNSAFPAFRKKESTTNFLLLPASTFEKFLVDFFIRVILFSLLFIFIFWLDFKLASLTYTSFDFRNNTVIPSFNLFDFYTQDMKRIDRVVITLSVFSFACYLFANASHFKKNIILKTIVLLGCFGCFIFLLNIGLSHLLLPNEVVGFETKVFHRNLDNGLNTIQICLYVLGSFSSLFFLPFTYFKLKEKEA